MTDTTIQTPDYMIANYFQDGQDDGDIVEKRFRDLVASLFAVSGDIPQFNSLADALVWSATATAGSPVLVNGYASPFDGGEFRGHVQATSNPNNPDGGNIKPAGNSVKPEMWGVKGDFVDEASPGTDDWEKLQRCIDFGADVIMSIKRHRVSDTLVMNTIGQKLIMHHQTYLVGDFLSKPVIRVMQRQIGVYNGFVEAMDARNAGPANDNGHGIVLGGVGAGSLTGCEVKGVVVARQPNDGIVVIGYAQEAIIQSCIVQYNKGHAYYWDDGTRTNDAKYRAGIMNMLYCVAHSNGGNAVNFGDSPSGTSFRIIVDNLETVSNAWNTALDNYVNAEVNCRAQNVEFRNCAFGDPGYADTVTAAGTARLSKSQRSDGIFLGSYCTDIKVSFPRFIDVHRAIKAWNYITNLSVEGGYYDVLHGNPAYEIGDNCTGIDLKISEPTFDPSVSNPVAVKSGSTGHLRINDRDYKLVGNSALSKQFALSGVETGSIVSGVLSCTGRTCRISSEDGNDDSFVSLKFQGSIDIPDGEEVMVVNETDDTITAVHGHVSGNVSTNSGANIVVGPNQVATFKRVGDVAYLKAAA